MSALPPKTDIPRRHHDVSFGPKADQAQSTKPVLTAAAQRPKIMTSGISGGPA
jgi:hypothetical protein